MRAILIPEGKGPWHFVEQAPVQPLCRSRLKVIGNLDPSDAGQTGAHGHRIDVGSYHDAQLRWRATGRLHAAGYIRTRPDGPRYSINSMSPRPDDSECASPPLASLIASRTSLLESAWRSAFS